jgi:type IV pilus assembly protein PilX
MKRTIQRSERGRQRGVVLISTMLLLIIMTIFAVSMFRSVGVQEMVAGNVREKQRSLQVAQSALQYAEYWVANNAGAGTSACAGVVSGNTPGNILICNTPLATPSTLPWGVGFTYNPGGSDLNVLTSPGRDTYYSLPQFYIWDAGVSAVTRCGELYQIDAWSYAGTTNTQTEVESTYLVTALACSGGGL